jgi:hypothetical protein
MRFILAFLFTISCANAQWFYGSGEAVNLENQIGFNNDVLAKIRTNGSGVIEIEQALETIDILLSGQLDVGNISISGNTISSTDTDGNIILAPDGTGQITTTADIVTTGSVSADSGLIANDITISGRTIELTDPIENMILQVGAGQFVEIKGSMEIDDDLTVLGEANVNGVMITEDGIEQLNAQALEIIGANDEDIALKTQGEGLLVTELDTRTYNLDPQITHGNLIPNASFERDDLTNISCTDATASFEASELGGEGNLRQLSITSTDTNWSCDIVGAGSEGQGLLSASLKTSVVDTEICALINSTEQICDDIRVTGQLDRYWYAVSLGATSNSVRIKGATSGDVVKVDMVELKQGALPTVSVDTDWLEYTPTLSAGFGTISTQRFLWRRVGADLHVRGFFTSGTVGSGNASISLPPNLSIDSGKVARETNTSQTSPVLGTYTRGNNASVITAGLILSATDTSLTSVYFGRDFSGNSLIPEDTVSNSFLSTENITLEFSVPIQGWTSNSTAFTAPCLGFECVQVPFTAKVSSAGVVSDPNFAGWVSNCTIAATGVYDCPVSPFSVLPNCQATSSDAGSGITAHVANSASSASLIRVITRNTSGTGTASSFNLDCSRSTDAKQQKQIVGSFQGVPQVVGEDGRFATGWASFGGAAITNACTTSPCTRYNPLGKQGSNMTLGQASTGVYNFTSTGWQSSASVMCDFMEPANIKCGIGPEELIADGSGVISGSIVCYNIDPGALSSTRLKISCTGEVSP